LPVEEPQRTKTFHEGKALPGIRAASQKRKEKRLDFPLQRCLRSALREVSQSYEKEARCPIRFL